MEEAYYYPFGLTMAGISSKAAGGIQNKFKFNGGDELQSAEFSDGSGMELYDAVHRMYDPQLGRFWQIDELAESGWEFSPYAFAYDNPIRFNDPLGLEGEDPNKPVTTAGTDMVGVTVKCKAKKLEPAQVQSLYYRLEKAGISIENVKSGTIRRQLEGYDGVAKFMSAVHDQQREQEKWALEVGSWFAPMGWLTKLRYVKYAAELFKLKRGATAGYVFYSGGKIANEAALKFVAENGGFKIIDNTLMGKGLDWLTKKTSYSITEPLWNAASKIFANGASGEIKVFLNLAETNAEKIFFKTELPILEKKGLEMSIKLVQ